MRMKKGWFCCLFLLLLGVGAQEAWAAESVPVERADFAVTLNGVAIDNAHRAYPLLVYQGAVYFPLTYDDCRFMGLESSWSKETGLSVVRTGVSAAYRAEAGVSGAQGQAMAADFPVTVAGRVAAEAGYPVLEFRGVAYLALTPALCREALGWECRYDAASGLVIDAANPRVEEIALQNGRPTEALMLTEDRLWLQDGQEVVNMPLDAPERRTVVRTLPIKQTAWEEEHIQQGRFRQIGEERYYELEGYREPDTLLERHRLRPEGQWEDIAQNTYQFGDYLVTIRTVDSMVTGNLSIQKIGEKNVVAADPRYHYYNGFNNERQSLVCYDDQLYLMACVPGDTHGIVICCLDLATGKILAVHDGSDHSRDGAMLYYESYDEQTLLGNHCRYDLKSGRATRLELPNVYESSTNLSSLAAINGQIYYTGLSARMRQSVEALPEAERAAFSREQFNAQRSGDVDLYRLGEEQTLNPGGRVRELAAMNGYVYAIFTPRAEISAAPYQLMVFDAAGKTVFKTTDMVTKAVIAGDRVAYSDGAAAVIHWAKLR